MEPARTAYPTGVSGYSMTPSNEVNRDVDIVVKNVHNYMRIVKQTIQDLTPKYIIRQLVAKVE